MSSNPKDLAGTVSAADKGMTAADAIERSFEERRNLMDQVKKKMRSGSLFLEV